MSILQNWRGVWQRAKEYTLFHGYTAERAAIVDPIAEEAYRYCVHLYGPPKNANKRYRLVQGEHSLYIPSFFGTPMISISRELEAQEHLCEVIAHEMYHRVAQGRKGIASELWVKEMMASLTSYWSLNYQGFQEYVRASRKTLIASEGEAGIHLLRRSSSSIPRHIYFGMPIYSQGFSGSVWRIGYALNIAVKGKDLCTLIKFDTFEAWVATLPAEDQYTVCQVLALSTKDKAIPCGNREVRNLLLALQAMGDKKALVEEFERLVHLQPTSGTAFFSLGYALKVAERFEDAIGAYTEAQRLGYTDKWLMNNIGNAYWRTQDYASAAKSYQKAVEQTPDRALIRYWLGWSLKNLGKVAEARQNWEIVTTLSDEHYAKLVQNALAENPLPDAVDKS